MEIGQLKNIEDIFLEIQKRYYVMIPLNELFIVNLVPQKHITHNLKVQNI